MVESWLSKRSIRNRSMSNDLILLDNFISQSKAELADEMSDSEYFELLLAEQITKDYDLTYDQIQAGLVGGGRDGGVDSIYVFVNGLLIEEDTEAPSITQDIKIHVIIAQAKNKTGYSEVVIDKFDAFAADVFDLTVDLDTLKDVYNAELLDTVERFRSLWSEKYVRENPTLVISFVYGSRAKRNQDDNIQRKADLLKVKIDSLFSGVQSRVKFLGASDLWELVKQRPKSTFNLKLAEPAIQMSDSKSLVALVKLSDYFVFMTDDSRQLLQHIFEANVRAYQDAGNTVNVQIASTLRRPQEEDFWWLNNGVTIVATRVSFSSKQEIRVENPEIVNGLQTSQEVYNYFSALTSDDETSMEDEWRSLLIRVIATDQDTSRDNIIRATNNQTPIPPESLKSTEKIHRDIEHHLKNSNIYYDRRKNYWKLQRKPISQILTIKKLAQAVQSIALYDPRTAKSKPSEIFREGNESRYKQVFSEDYPINLYSFCAGLLLRVELILKSDLIQTDLNKRAVGQIKFHTLTHVVIRATEIPEPAPYEIAKLRSDEIADSFIADSAQNVLIKFEALDATNTASKSAEFAKAVIDDAKALLGVTTET